MSVTSVTFGQENMVQVPIQREEKLRYPRRPLDTQSYAQSLRGRQMTIKYARDGVTYGKVMTSTLSESDTYLVTLGKIQSTLLAAKVGWSQVVAIEFNHGISPEIAEGIKRRIHASKN